MKSNTQRIFGSNAAYRGDKLTRRMFGEILQTEYVAQTLVQPRERQLQIGDQSVELKPDLRHYAYQAPPGGGFAQVLMVPQTAEFA